VRTNIAFLLIVTALAAAGCQSTYSLAGADAKLPADDSAAFMDGLSSQPSVNEAQALRGFLLVLGQDKPMSFGEAVTALKQQGVVDKNWDFQPTRPITRGRVAYMFYTACKVPGGLTLTLCGPSPRYCLRELQYRGWMSTGLPDNEVTGLEFVSVLTRADELKETGKVSNVMVKETLQ
jgi:hypothetical protein